MQHQSPLEEPPSSALATEFDQYAADYSAGMENSLKRLAGTDAETFIELKAWHLCEDLRRRPMSPAGRSIRLLDFGCGDGVLLRVLARSGFAATLYGSDVSSRMLQSARAKWRAFVKTMPAYNMNEPSWVKSTPGSLPLESASFDVVTCLGVFHHISPADRSRDWAEIARVLRPGGRCYVFEHNPYNPLTQWVVRHTAIDKNAMMLTQQETIRSLRHHGLTTTRAYGLMYWPPRWRALWRAERLVQWIPLGGQFVVVAERPK